MTAKIRNPLTYMGGGSPTPPTPQPLDPEQVYRDTRPADWLVMPEPQNGEAYFLYMVDADALDDQIICLPVAQNAGGTISMEFGTSDAQGNFTADPALTVTSTTTSVNELSATIPMSAYGNLTSEGRKQIICKLSSTTGLTGVLFTTSNNLTLLSIGVTGMVEANVNITTNTALYLGNASRTQYSCFDLVYAKTSGCKTVTFSGLTRLRAYRGGTGVTSFNGMFNGCRSLVAIPQLDTSSGAILSNMFSGCASLKTIPLLDTGNGTNFSQMFYGCTSLVAIPQLDTSSGTIFNGMFRDCYSLTTTPQLDTASGTIFSSMFYNCLTLTSVPQLDTSGGTDFSYMFYVCSALTAVPLLDTSSGTNFSYMFNNCTTLTSIPQLNTSSGTNFSHMFDACHSLVTIPQLNTSSGTDFSYMFNNCDALIAVPSLNTSSGTNFNAMFQGCPSLSSIDFTNYDFSHVTTTNGLSSLISGMRGGRTIDFGDSWGASGILNTAVIVSTQSTYVINDNRAKIRINKTDAMLPIAANATTLFNSSGGYSPYVYVPDALLATYQADTYWNTLGTRLKAMSEWSA